MAETTNDGLPYDEDDSTQPWLDERGKRIARALNGELDEAVLSPDERAELSSIRHALESRHRWL